jgi:hypothetical protein
MYVGLEVKCPLLLSYFNATWIFSTDLKKILKYQIPAAAELFHADGRRQTDMTKLIVAVRNFANVPNKGKFTFTSSVQNCLTYILGLIAGTT